MNDLGGGLDLVTLSQSTYREVSDGYISVIMQLTRGRLRLELVKIEYVQYCKEIAVI